jgi:Holliday junction resolvasome RuvABC ATP-dependent DNA helicase subunit
MARKLPDFHGFIGQKEIVAFLLKQLEGAQERGVIFPHLLLQGASGMGKTHLARSLARENGTTCVSLIGKNSPGLICEKLIAMRMGDFLFLDEAHDLPKDSQEFLLEVIDATRDTTGAVTDKLGPAVPANRDNDGKLLVPQVTFVLATDRAGKLAKALLKRCDIHKQLTDYTDRELGEIGRRVASNLNVVFKAQAINLVARSSQGSPRRIKQILLGMSRHYGTAKKEWTTEDVRQYLIADGCDPEGLPQPQVRYLHRLYEIEQASQETLAATLELDPDYLYHNIEIPLIKMGLITIGCRGRELTPKKGMEWVHKRKSKVNTTTNTNTDTKEKESA